MNKKLIVPLLLASNLFAPIAFSSEGEYIMQAQSTTMKRIGEDNIEFRFVYYYPNKNIPKGWVCGEYFNSKKWKRFAVTQLGLWKSHSLPAIAYTDNTHDALKMDVVYSRFCY